MTDDKEAVPPAERPDTAAMTDRQLAKAILAREIRPRVAEVRRLAEAVIVGAAKKNAAKKGKKAKTVRKLAKIPGQKKRR